MQRSDIKRCGAARVGHQVADTLSAPQRELAALAVVQAVDPVVDVAHV
jgi:hypothetical protein